MIVVDDDGPADHASLTAAVMAAPEGSTVLVRRGRHDVSPELLIERKALALVADGPGVSLVGGPIVVRNLGGAQHFVVDGFSVLPQTRDAYYLVSSTPAASFQRPFLGPLVVARPCRKFFAGTLDAQGTLTIAIPAELPAESEVAVSYVQALFVGHGRSFTLSTPAVLVVLDPTF